MLLTVTALMSSDRLRDAFVRKFIATPEGRCSSAANNAVQQTSSGRSELCKPRASSRYYREAPQPYGISRMTFAGLAYLGRNPARPN